MLAQRVQDPLSLNFLRTPVDTDSDRGVSSLLSQLNRKKQEWWEEAVNSTQRVIALYLYCVSFSRSLRHSSTLLVNQFSIHYFCRNRKTSDTGSWL